MAELVEDWSLQAIVRGSSGDFGKIVDIEMDGVSSFFDFHHQQFDDQDIFTSGFPADFFEVSTATSNGDELEKLYKPFYPVIQTSTIVDSQQDHKLQANNDQISDQSSGTTTSVASVTAPAAYTPKYKKRKNQLKRVVIQVSAEGLASDMWAWRKYGQKPIKGSPYPRSYYRCSSTKGCLARKQVEQSCTDPGMFIITYTAEHSHSQPTRRNSLAGTVRQKFPSSNTRNVKQEKTIEKLSSPPKTCQPLARIKEEKKVENETRTGDDGEGDIHGDNNFMMSDEFVFNDDFFSGIENFDEFIAEVPVCHASAQQFPVRSCT